MTDAAARDDEAGRPAGWHPWLLLLLAFTLAPRAIDDALAGRATLLAAHNPWRFWFPLATGAIEIVGLVAAGILVDRYGVRLVASLSLFVWGLVIASLSLFVRDSPLLYLMHNGAVFVGLFFNLVPGVAAKLAVPPARRARFLAPLELASTAWLLGVPSIASAANWPPTPSWRAPGPSAVSSSPPAACFSRSSGGPAALARSRHRSAGSAPRGRCPRSSRPRHCFDAPACWRWCSA